MRYHSFNRPLTIVIDRHHQIAHVGNGPPPPDRIDSTHTLINGDLAHQLYTALTGHHWDTHPRLASRQQALRVRQQIKNNNLVGARIVESAIKSWGPIIKPWLGVVKLHCQRPVLDDPDYDQIIELQPDLAA